MTQLSDASNYSGPLEIVDEDDFLLVVNKPAGVATMGLAPPKRNLWDDILDHLRVAGGCKPFAATQGRLDFHVAGLILVAKQPSIADDMRRQQYEGRLTKFYEAIVSGRIEPESGTLAHWLNRSPRHRSVEVTPEPSADSQQAVMHYETIERSTHLTRLKVVLQTGRKHQIRAQLAYAGHPILGDFKYGCRVGFSPGIALVCRRIQMMHPDGQLRNWYSSTPLEFCDA